MMKVDWDHVYFRHLVNEAIRSSNPLPSSAFASGQSSATQKKDKGPNKKEEAEKNIVLNIRIFQIFSEKT